MNYTILLNLNSLPSFNIPNINAHLDPSSPPAFCLGSNRSKGTIDNRSIMKVEEMYFFAIRYRSVFSAPSSSIYIVRKQIIISMKNMVSTIASTTVKYVLSRKAG